MSQLAKEQQQRVVGAALEEQEELKAKGYSLSGHRLVFIPRHCIGTVGQHRVITMNVPNGVHEPNASNVSGLTASSQGKDGSVTLGMGGGVQSRHMSLPHGGGGMQQQHMTMNNMNMGGMGMGMPMQGHEMYMEAPAFAAAHGLSGGMGFGPFSHMMHPEDMMYAQAMHPEDLMYAQHHGGMHPEDMMYAQASGMMHPDDIYAQAQDSMGGPMGASLEGMEYYNAPPLPPPPSHHQLSQYQNRISLENRRHSTGGIPANAMFMRRAPKGAGAATAAALRSGAIGPGGIVPARPKGSSNNKGPKLEAGVPSEVTVAEDTDSLSTPDEGGGARGSNKVTPAGNCKKQRAPSSSSFPIKLHKILSDAQYREYISWLPHGRAWRVLKPKAFEEVVIPKFFRSDRYASFMRQVNGWGFKRITEGPDLNAYYHEMFLRGLPGICARMRRPQKGFSANTQRDLGECPDFYKISMFAPLPDPDALDGSPGPKAKQTSKKLSKDPHMTTTTTTDCQQDEITADLPQSSIVHSSEADSPKAKRVEIDSDHVDDLPKDSDHSPMHGAMYRSKALGTSRSQTPSSMSSSSLQQHHQKQVSIPTTPNSPSDYAKSPYIRMPPSPTFLHGAHGIEDHHSITSWPEADHEGAYGWAGEANVPMEVGVGGFRMAHMGSVLGGNNHNHSGSLQGGRLMLSDSEHSLNGQQMQHGGMSSVASGGGDTSGLSVADLCYLTHQNRVLLKQARKGKPYELR